MPEKYNTGVASSDIRFILNCENKAAFSEAERDHTWAAWISLNPTFFFFIRYEIRLRIKRKISEKMISLCRNYDLVYLHIYWFCLFCYQHFKIQISLRTGLESSCTFCLT
jgi:hypothetical protein